MKISPFTPLRFGGGVSDGRPSRFVQTWAPGDRIMLQVIAGSGESEPAVSLIDACSGRVIGSIAMQHWQMNAAREVWFAVLSGLSTGHYIISVGGVEKTKTRNFRGRCLTQSHHHW